LYGGGGGGGVYSQWGQGYDQAGGPGVGGLIVITYTPVGPVERPSMVEIWGGYFRQKGGSIRIY
jgi:hypothetical protein